MSLSEVLDDLARYPSTSAAATLTLPPNSYTDPDVHEHELATVFHTEWVLVARTARFARPGDYLGIELAGEPLLIVRDRDGVLRALSAVCRHRAMLLVPDGGGHTDTLTCPYHPAQQRRRVRPVTAPDRTTSGTSSPITEPIGTAVRTRGSPTCGRDGRGPTTAAPCPRSLRDMTCGRPEWLRSDPLPARRRATSRMSWPVRCQRWSQPSGGALRTGPRRSRPLPDQ